MKAGRLDRRVTILRRTFTRDAHNEEIEGDPEQTQTFAEARPAPGNERFASDETAANAPVMFKLRWREDLVRVTDGIEWEGRTYAVLSVNQIGRHEGIEVLASARGETA